MGELSKGMREGDKHTLALQLGRMYARTRALGSISDPGSPVRFSDRPIDTVVKGAPARDVSRVSLRGMPRRVYAASRVSRQLCGR